MTTINYPLAFIGDLLAPGHIVLILLIALLLFGKRLPEVAHSLGKSFSEFKKGLQEGQNELNAMMTDKPDQQNPPLPPSQAAQQVQPSQTDNVNKTP